MPVIDFDALLHPAIVEIWGDAVSYQPVMSSPGAPAFALNAVFDREHEVILEDVKGSTIDAPGHSTTKPVLTVRLSDFTSPPEQGDRITVDGDVFEAWDVQPDGQGMADIVLEQLIAP